MGFLSFFFRPASLITGGAFGLIGLIVYLGYQFQLPWLYIIIAAAAIFLIWVIVLIVMRVRAAKAAAVLEVSLDRQAQDQLHATRPGREAEVEALRRNLTEAIEALKTSRVGKSGGRSALYVLPWYMIIGPPASGKSTLLTNSGLNFPYMDKTSKRPTVKGVGGTRNCDWWFADEAVMLDTAGRYTLPVESDDTKEWVAFLDMLRDTRGKKPINGLIVAVSIQDLLSGSEEMVEQHGQKIRARIDEVIEHLGISFPIYVVFTKCDLVRGFVEFFGDLGRDERAHVWGATLARDKVAQTPAAALFEQEMGALSESLHRSRIPRMSQVAAAENRPDVLFFPLQFDALQRRLGFFIESLFKENPYQERPIFRGFYFTSGTQEGRPIDQVINAMLSGFGMGQADEAMYVEPSQTKSYFIENVFSRIMFPDRHIAGPSAEAERSSRSKRSKLFTIGAVALLILLIPLIWLSVLNRGLLSDARSLADQSQAIVDARTQELPMSSLETLDALRGKIEEMGRKGNPVSKALSLGTYQADRAVEDTRNLYLSVLNDAVMRPAIRSLSVELSRNADSLRVGFVDYYRLYRTWRILLDPAERLKEGDAPLVADHLTNFWAPASRITIDGEIEAYHELIEKQLAYASGYPAEMGMLYPPIPSDTDPLDDRSRAALQRYWTVDLVYPELGRRTRDVADKTVSGIVGGVKTVVGQDPVPGTYTKEAWDGPVKGFLDEVEAYREDWVMERAFNGSPPSLRGFMVTRYGSEYADRWRTFVNGVSLQGGGVQETKTFLDASSKPSSPVLAVLREVSHNTTFDDPSMIRVQEQFAAVQEMFRRPEMGGFTVLTRADGDMPLADEYLEKISTISDQYTEIVESSDPKTSEPILALGSWVAQKVPPDTSGAMVTEVGRILMLPVSSVSGTVIRGATQNLGQAWQPVYREFRDLSGRFPLDPTSDRDIAISEFEQFFSPGGTFWSFYEANLADKVSMDGQPKGSGVTLSGDFLTAMKKAYRIRRAVFPSGSRASFRFSLRPRPPNPLDLAITSRSTQILIGGEDLLYRMGARNWVEFQWPGPNGENGAQLRFDAGDSGTIRDMEYAGVWGFFRMLQRASIAEGGSNADLRLTWTLSGEPAGVEVSYEVRGLSGNHPLSKNFFRFSLPSSITQ